MNNQLKITKYSNLSLPGNVTISSTTNLKCRRNLFNRFHEPFTSIPYPDRLPGRFILVRGTLPLKVSLLLFELSNWLFLDAFQLLLIQVSVQINSVDFQSLPSMQSFHPCLSEFKSDYITCFVREY